MLRTVGYDWGGNGSKLVSDAIIEHFPSTIVGYRPLKVDKALRKYDFIFEFGERKGFAGTLADEEKTSLDVNLRGDTKYHQDALIRLLIGLHQFFRDTEFNVVVGQPIAKHSGDKALIRDMLIGDHTLTVNNTTKTITIRDAQVAAEGAAAFYSNPIPGEVHIIDIGSGTINMATMKDRRFISTKSKTLPKGLEDTEYDHRTIAELIRNHAVNELEWKVNGQVFLVGGGAYVLETELANFFPNCRQLCPFYRGEMFGPELANAIGFYKVGERLYG